MIRRYVGSRVLVRSSAVSKNREQNQDSEATSMPRGSLSRFEAGRVRPETDRASHEADEQSAGQSRLRVDDRGVHRPFMRGILVHSLTEQGFSFEDAYAVSQEVWTRVSDRKLVTKKELRESVAEITTALSVGQSDRLDPNVEDELDVLGKDGRWPFSQGRLQHSLLAAGIEPRLAFEVVVEIERELRYRGERRVSRDAIRSLAGATHTVEATAIPLIGQSGDLHGSAGVFWEVADS